MQYPVGTKVRVDSPKHPGVWIVESNGPKNASLKPEGGGRGLRCPHSLLRLDDGKGPTIVPVEMYAMGETVTIGDRFPGIYVVVKDDGGPRLNVARLGGDGDRYVRAGRPLVKRIDVKVVPR
jgi:hypothetical protein